MTALVALRLRTLLLSQRYLAPVLAFLAASAIFCTGDSGPVLPTYALMSGLVLAATSWIAMTVVSVEEPTVRDVAIVSSGGSRFRVVASAALLATEIGLVLTILATALPLLSSHGATAADVRDGALAALSAALTGVAVGMICSRLVIERAGYGLVAAASLVFALLRFDVPPVGHLLRQLSAIPPQSRLLLALGTDVLIAAALVVASVAAATYASDRTS